ncbi:MAG: TatD family hydrolase [Succinivibrio sp.]
MHFDCHVHVMMHPDPAALISKAEGAGFCMIAPSCTPDESERALDLKGEIRSGAFHPMCGIHPWHAESDFFDAERFDRMASGGAEGMGEIGLDALSSPISMQSQEHLLEQELELACARGLPVSLHVRKAHGSLIRILKRFKSRLDGGVVHNFTFSKEIAREYLSLGLKLSVGHHILQGAERLRQSLLFAGPSNVVLETDADYEHTGEYDFSLIPRQEEAFAGIFCLDLGRAREILENNARTIFKNGGGQ